LEEITSRVLFRGNDKRRTLRVAELYFWPRAAVNQSGRIKELAEEYKRARRGRGEIPRNESLRVYFI